MSQVLFFLAGFGAIAGAIGVVMLRDPFFAVLALVAHLLSLAILFLLLRAEFVAAVQVVVYAGAVMVLYVFVVAYVGGREEPIGDLLRGRGPAGAQLRLGAAILGGALLIELLIALLGTGLKAVGGDGAPYTPGPKTFGTPAYIGQLLLTRFLLVFEVASLLLLIAAVGAVVLARRRGGIEEDGEGDAQRVLTPLDLIRPPETGTMAEGVGGAQMSIGWYLAVSAIVFSLGAAGVMVRRNPLVVLLCLELMLNGANLALVAFSRMWGNGDGQVFALIVMTVAACEVCIGLGLIVAIHRRKLPIDVDELRELQG